MEAILKGVTRDEKADVIALPWSPSRHAPWFRFCRKTGITVALWARPLDMMARSGCPEDLFTPTRKMSTRGGFGRLGTATCEFRHLERNCSQVLFLVGETEAAAAAQMVKLLGALMKKGTGEQDHGGAYASSADALQHWARQWVADYDASPSACEVLIEAMARYLDSLCASGATPRHLRGVTGDLNAAGLLVMRQGGPNAAHVLMSFLDGSPDAEYARLFSNSPASVGRFRATWDGFARFLRDLTPGDSR